jgi:hypothetical protein
MSTTQNSERGSGAAFEAPYFDRVRVHTPRHVNRRIDRETAADLERFVAADPEQILRRLAELDREWDIDRAVMALLAAGGSLNLFLSLRRWLSGRRPGRATAVLGLQLAFLFHHARAGWCPPVAILRRLGLRTRMEIEEEKRALVALLSRPQVSESVLVIASE